MATLMDDRISMKEETTYGTLVTTDRFYPMLDDNEGDWDSRLRQGEGLHGGTGRRSPLAARNYPTIGQGTVTVKAELESKAGGVLLRAACGASTVTAITGGSQQLFHPGIAGTYLPSFTIQLVRVQNGGTERVETYGGCTAGKMAIEQPEDDIPTIEVEFDAASYTTAVAAAPVSYATNPVLFDAFMAACGLGGTLTVPTATALATGLTATSEFREWKLELDHQIDDSDWKLGSRGRPTAGAPKVTFAGKADFDSNTLPDALVAGTKLPWYCTHTTTEGLGAGFTQLQVVVPKLVLTKGLPKIKRGETRMSDLAANVLNDGTNQDFYVAYRTTDTAL
jgi:hypothetical protein